MEPISRPLPSTHFPLPNAPIGQSCRIVALQAPASGDGWPQRLAELGFLPGENVRVLARAMPGANPLAVRVGTSTFALRQAEALCVLCVPVQPQPAATPPGAS